MADKEQQQVESEGVRAYPARVNVAASDDSALIAVLKARASDPTIFDESPPFIWPAEISNNSIDAHFSRMMPSSLKNYAADCERGIAFQNSHNTRELPLGGSITGKFIGAQGNGAARVEANFFTIPDLQLGQLSTNEFIRGVRSGVVRDVSIGFYGGRSVCSVCNGDMWDWNGECRHWPGDEYDVHDANGKVTGKAIAIEQIEDARLAEVSAVYDGACPGAAIQKAVALMDAGILKPERARILEQRYRIKLPGARHVWPGKEGERTMPEENVNLEEEPTTDAKLSVKRGTETVDLNFGTNRALADQVQSILTAHETELTALRASQLTDEIRSLADDGRTYRKDMIDETVAEGVRAHGNTFPEESYRAMLEKASIVDIKKMRDSFTAKGDATFKPGRATVDTEPAPLPVQAEPDAAFVA